MPGGRVGEGWQAFANAVSSPRLSRRIYARRAALAGLLIATTLFLLLLQGHIGTAMTIPVIFIGLCFAALFTGPLAEIVAIWSRNRFYTSRSGQWIVFPLTFAISPILAPVVLAVSTVQFLKSTS